ncbi:CBN-CLEC-50 protein [Aphelenchoides avenae]|nr:CBN-CLEC-50 protein [Aphelenchus avenae]KAH7704345.1 CBN-CLEC-50 protein [Aphelenchus avenae]
MRTLLLTLLVGLTTASAFHDQYAQCPNGSIPGFPYYHLSPCYLYETYPAQWVVAELHCRTAGGRLASVADLFANDFIAQAGVEAFSILGIDRFWIGGNDLEVPGQWEWTDGKPWNFTYWQKGHPVSDPEAGCLAIRLTQGYWENTNCYENLQYVCALPAGSGNITRGPFKPTTVGTSPDGKTVFTTLKPTPNHVHQSSTGRPHSKPPASTEKPHSGPPATTRRPRTRHPATSEKPHTRPHTKPHPPTTRKPPAFKQCEYGWKYLEESDSCYLWVDVEFGWYANRIYCESIGAELASVHSERENEFIADLVTLKDAKIAIGLFNKGDDWWDAAQKSQPGLAKHAPKKAAWEWSDSTELDFTRWAKSEPSKNKGCALLEKARKGKKNQWVRTDCVADLSHAVCKKKWEKPQGGWNQKKPASGISTSLLRKAFNLNR